VHYSSILLIYYGTTLVENSFLKVFAFTLVIRITWKKKPYQAMDLPVNGETDDLKFNIVRGLNS